MEETGSTASSGISVFWGEIAPCDHFVQIYEHDDVFLDTLQGFVEGGLRTGDGTIVIATHAHLKGLEERLSHHLDLEAARRSDQYVPVVAAEALEGFMNRGWPDEERFGEMVSRLLARARGGGRRVRAFGEMVALLWAQGHRDATVRLENLWHRICREQAFSLFCAYPRTGFTTGMTDGIREICDVHSKVVPGSTTRR